jgi:hypothetical protein
MSYERKGGLIINLKQERFNQKRKFILELILVVIISPFLIFSFTRATTYTTIGNNIDTAGTLTVAGNANIDSGTLFVDSTIHKVSIGTTSPITPLTVNGDISVLDQSAMRFYELSANGTEYAAFKASSSMPSTVVWTLPVADGSAGQMLTTNSSGNLYWSTAAGSGTVNSGLIGQLAFYDSNGTAVSGTSTLFISADGKMGVGTVVPGQRLSVQGVGGSTDVITMLNSSGSIRGSMYLYANQSGSLYLNDSNGVNKVNITTEDVSFFNGGNVGIGTTSPSQKLEVNGAIIIPRGWSYMSRLSNGAPTNLLSVDGLDRTQLYNPWSGQGITILSNGNTGIGTSSPYSRLTVWSSGTTTGQALNVVNSASTSLLTVLDNGKVGVGTDNPQSNLDVVSTSETGISIRSTNAVGASANLYLIGRTGGSDYWSTINAGWDGTMQFAPASGSGGLRFYTNSWTALAMAINGVSGNVSIGTTTSYAKLTVWSSGTTTGRAFNVVNSASTSLLTVLDNGNVGIGIAPSPNLWKLYVNGDIKAIGDVYADDGAASAPSFGFSNSYNSGMFSPLQDTIGFSIAGSEKMRINSSGYLGIGTTSPVQKLVINNGSLLFETGESEINGILFTTPNSGTNRLALTGSTHGTILRSIDGDAGDGIFFQNTSQANQMFIRNSDGYIGIGTTSPSANLDVIGTLDFSDVTGNVSMFDNQLIGNTTDGNSLYIKRHAAEGDSYIRFYTNEWTEAIIETPAGTDMKYNAGSSVYFSGNYYYFQKAGLNPPIRHFGNLNSAEKYIQWQLNDVTDNFELTRQDTNIGKFDIQMPTVFTNGNVGIGTTSPYAKLTVWSSGTTTGQAFNVVNSASTSLLTVLDNGNMGIGTTNPGKKLEIYESGGIDTTVKLSSTAGEYSELTYSNTNNALILSSNSGGTPALMYLRGDSGNVGIGTNTPSATLTIGTGAVNHSAVSSVTGSALVTGYFESNNGAFFDNGICVGGSCSSSNFANGQLITLGNASIGTTSPYARLTVWSSGITTGQAFNVVNSASTSLMTVLDNGSVGIGTVNPSSKLTMQSTLALESAPISATEIADGNNWTVPADQWSGTYAGGFTHTATTTASDLVWASSTASIAAGNYYQVIFTVSGYSAGTIDVAIGNATSSIGNGSNNTVNFAPKTINSAASGGYLTFIPSNTFVGTVSNISVKQITSTFSPIYTLQDASSNSVFQIHSASSTQANIYIGNYAGSYNTTGYNNVTLGNGNLRNNTSGSQNTALGHNALVQNTAGSGNTAIGYQALNANTTGIYNLAVGSNALNFNTSGSGNTALGYNSLNANTTGSLNIAIGQGTLRLNTSGTGNTAIGYTAMNNSTSGSYNLALGYGTLNNNATGNYNHAIGYNAVYSNTSGTDNLGIGYNPLYSNTTGTDNIALGRAAMYTNITGQYNVALGNFAMRQNASATSSVAIGHNAGYGVAGQTFSRNNVFLGYQTGYSNTTGSNNTLVGYQAGYDLSSGSYNIVLGYNVNPPDLTTDQQLNIGNLIYGTGLHNGARSSAPVSAGKVGIGTTSPFAKLSIAGAPGGIIPMFTISTSTAAFATSTAFIIDANGLVGVGTSTPHSKVQVSGGDVYIDTIGSGVIIRSPGGSCFRLTFSDIGAISTSSLACP